MSRKKHRDKDPARFTNTPFKGLKLPTSGEPDAAPRTRVRPDPRPQPHVDDADLFLRAMDAMDRRSPGTAPTASARRSSAADEDEDRALFLASLDRLGRRPSCPSSDREQDPARISRSPASKMKLLRRGDIRIDAQLDLHGLAADDAVSRLSRFLEESAARGAAAVLVITGKGLNSPNGPVLPGAVKAWLNGPGKRIVSEFGIAPRDLGGLGALVLFLRR